ncbi:MAG: hypothetical protein RHS_5180 [Robinsoniella sp. RHS]|nr:MAG: hypothetical protein RHS_5180 [Robinsoniella sp. RHS]
MIAKQMGVGGDDSWGAPIHDEYLIDPKEPLTLRFAVRGVSNDCGLGKRDE